MAEDTPFAIATGVIGILTFPTVIIAAVAAFLAYTRRYRGAPEETNIFLSVVKAYQKELELFRDDYGRLREASGPVEESVRLVMETAETIQTAAEAALIRLRQELEDNGFNLTELDVPVAQRKLAWVNNSDTLRKRLQERVQLTGSLALIKMSILHARIDTVELKLAAAETNVINRLGRIAPDGLLGRIQTSISESEGRILKRLQELEASLVARV